jgi:taurine dioxygenase
MRNTTLDIEPLSGALGAEIGGINLAQHMSDGVFDELHEAFMEHQVLFFRDQDMTPTQHKAFTRRFGELHVHPYIAGLPEHPQVMEFVKEPQESGYVVGSLWHSDTTFLSEPALGSVLYAHEVPPHGGDTQFANMYAAYDALSEGLKRMLGQMQAVHSSAASYGKGGRFDANRDKGQGNMTIDVTEDQGIVHPVVRTHPVTQRKLLFVNSSFTQRFSGWSVDESQPLLQFLYKHTGQPEFACRFRWEEHSVAMWDNRCTQHLAVNDYDGYRRRMHRVTVVGDQPY